MLAFDIETEGLNPVVHHITCACAFDPEAGIKQTFIFSRGDSPEEFMALLDGASQLCTFNGVRFDVPFIAKQWQVPMQRVGAWMLKLVDVYEAARLCAGRGFSLNALLLQNQLPTKTGSGLEAIDMAHSGRWEELAEYCMHDTQMTYEVTCRDVIWLPLGDSPRGQAMARNPLRFT